MSTKKLDSEASYLKPISPAQSQKATKRPLEDAKSEVSTIEKQDVVIFSVKTNTNLPTKKRSSISKSGSKSQGKGKGKTVDLKKGANVIGDSHREACGNSPLMPQLPKKKKKIASTKGLSSITTPQFLPSVDVASPNSRNEIVPNIKREVKDEGYDSTEVLSDEAESSSSPKLEQEDLPSSPSSPVATTPSPCKSDSETINNLKEETNQDTCMDVTILGPNGTTVPTSVYLKLYNSTASLATRLLLSTVFGREILATHSLTGKESPAFKGLEKPPKKQLDPLIVEDIITAVSQFGNGSIREIRLAITTKCADENKMMRKLAKAASKTG